MEETRKKNKLNEFDLVLNKLQGNSARSDKVMKNPEVPLKLETLNKKFPALRYLIYPII